MPDQNAEQHGSDVPENEPSDEQLIELTREGDTNSYAALWARHANAGRTVARGMGQNVDADDLVSEAFLVILDAIRRGKGPTGAFRPYLFTTVRNLAMKWGKAQRHSSDDELNELADPTTTSEAETAFLENSITVRAFKNLPERWQTVLWYTEVENLKPSEAGVLMGMSASSCAALAYRAREGLRREWLQAHINNPATGEECRWASMRMADHNRGALGKRDEARFKDHVDGCVKCSILVEEIEHVGSRLSIMLLPLMLGGTAAAAYIASLKSAPASAQAVGPESGNGGNGGTQLDAKGASSLGRTAVVVGVVLVACLAVGAVGVSVFNLGRNTSATVIAPVEPAPDETAPDETVPSETAPDEAAPDSVPEAPAPVEQVVLPTVPTKPTTPVDPTIPVDTVAPAAPVVLFPADASTVATTSVVVSGTGEAGATVRILSGATTVATAVTGAGSWEVPVPLAVGTQSLVITQTDAAGNVSASTMLTITVDNFAAPPVITPPTDARVHVLPDLAGTAEPGATVEVSDSTGIVATATADTNGDWTASTVGLAPFVGQTFTAVQTDVLGNRSESSTPTTPFDYQVPTITDLTVGPGDVVSVTVTGVVDMHAQIFYGAAGETTSGTLHHLATGSVVRFSPSLAPGTYVFRVRYADDADANGVASPGDRFGALSQQSIIVIP